MAQWRMKNGVECRLAHRHLENVHDRSGERALQPSMSWQQKDTQQIDKANNFRFHFIQIFLVLIQINKTSQQQKKKKQLELVFKKK